MNKITWSLANSCEGRFEVGQRVRTRGDMGSFEVTIVIIHNSHFCKARTWRFGKLRHFNMNVLEEMQKP